jgi:hypothetical protein
MGNLTLADELLLLAYNDVGTSDVARPALDYGLAGALLIELTLAERITIQDNDRIAVTSPLPVGEPRLDEALTRIAGDRARKPKDWVVKLSSNLRDKTLDAVIAAGVLRRERGTVLWVFQRTYFPSSDGTEPVVETEVRQRLAAAVAAAGPVEPRTAALCALVRAVKLEKQVFAGLPKDQVRARLKEISEGETVAAATRKAIEDMQAAVMVAVMVPVITTTASG